MSGISGDLRQVLEAADRGSARAQLAYQRFVLTVRRGVGAMVGVLGGVDAVVFTGGIGENSARVRLGACRALGFAGPELNEQANASDDRDISVPTSPVRVLATICATRHQGATVRRLVSPPAGVA